MSNLNPKYAKLTDAILAKKITSYIAQCTDLREAMPDVLVSVDCDIDLAHLILGQSDPSRTDLENICTCLADNVTKLKTHQKRIAQEELERAQALAARAQERVDLAEKELSAPPAPQTINGGGLESLKREFFNQNVPATSEMHTVPFGFYKGVYKYGSDMDGRPDFIARNLNTQE